MITRIVQMTFEPENIPSFERIFQTSQDRIRSFPGCRHLELYRDLNDPLKRFTYSIWDSEEALEAYRKSEFFQTVWGRTRKLFADRPKAWSLEKCPLG
jgi:heme-degrading monooxygenase HmoA